MTSLTKHDLSFAVLRLPKPLKTVMLQPKWRGKLFVGGGYLRAICSGESVNDVDVFLPSVTLAEDLVKDLQEAKDKRRKLTHSECGPASRVIQTDNAITLLGYNPTIQIIHRWTYRNLGELIRSFDFSVCCAAIGYSEDQEWESECDERFYPDLASKRLVYRSPIRIEELGGSLLRVLKYYQKGYRIPLDSFSAVLARLYVGINKDAIERRHGELEEEWTARVILGLLRVVDPMVDPLHEAHLPAENTSDEPDTTDGDA